MRSASTTRFSYLPATPNDRAWGVRVRTVGVSRIAPGQPYPPVQHPGGYRLDWTQGRILNEFQLVYISEGEGLLETRRTLQSIVAGDVFILRPKIWHRYRPLPATGWQEHWVGFDGPWAQRIVRQAFKTVSVPTVRLSDERAFAAAFHALQGLSDLGIPNLESVLAGHTLTILGWLLAANRPIKRSEESPEDMQAAMAALAREDASAISLPDLAASMNMSYSRFRRRFRERFGVSPHQFRLHCRLTEARRLLGSTSLSVKEIGSRSGFESEQYFCRLFKEHIGCTPGDFRRLRMHAVATF